MNKKNKCKTAQVHVAEVLNCTFAENLKFKVSIIPTEFLSAYFESNSLTVKLFYSRSQMFTFNAFIRIFHRFLFASFSCASLCGTK